MTTNAFVFYDLKETRNENQVLKIKISQVDSGGICIAKKFFVCFFA